MRVLSLYAALALALIPPGLAETYVIAPDGSGDFPTIQAGIDACGEDDDLELTNGVFLGPGNRDLTLGGRNISIRSQGGASVCVIDSEGQSGDRHRAFDLASGEYLFLQDITIRGGNSLRGGGIRSQDAILSVRMCRFSNCEAYDFGGGIWTEGGELILRDCDFDHCSGRLGGGGIWTVYTSVEATDTIFQETSAQTGGACHIYYGGVAISDCTFMGIEGAALLINSEGYNTDISATTFYGCQSYAIEVLGAHVDLDNVLIADGEDVSIELIEGATANLRCCDIFGNAGGDWVGQFAGQLGINGNISEDPLFCDPMTRDLTLHANSPCAPYTEPNPECDLIGAWQVGCEPTPVSSASWGEIKAIFR